MTGVKYYSKGHEINTSIIYVIYKILDRSLCVTFVIPNSLETAN